MAAQERDDAAGPLERQEHDTRDLPNRGLFRQDADRKTDPRLFSLYSSEGRAIELTDEQTEAKGLLFTCFGEDHELVSAEEFNGQIWTEKEK